MRYWKSFPAVVVVAGVLVSTALPVLASTITIEFPGATFSVPIAINDRGQIVGYYIRNGVDHGFVLDNGVFTTIDVPGADASRALGINKQGDIVGYYLIFGKPCCPLQQYGYLLHKGRFFTIGESFTEATGINDRGQIVGKSNPLKVYNAGFGFVLDGGVFRTIDVPGAQLRQGINNRGDILGSTFVLHRGVVTTINVPGASRTLCTGINDHSQIAGTYTFGALGFVLDNAIFPTFVLAGVHGFVLDKGVFKPIDVPGAAGTLVTGVNDRGDVVGLYAVDSIGSVSHGFVMRQ